jgi:hypothetical protein
MEILRDSTGRTTRQAWDFPENAEIQKMARYGEVGFVKQLNRD